MDSKNIAIAVIFMIVLIGIALIIAGFVASSQRKSSAYPLLISGGVLLVLFNIILYFVLRS